MKRYKKGIALMLALAMTLTPFGTAAGALLSAGESEAVPASERAAETEAASETDTAAETEVYEETETFTETEITRETEAATETAEDTGTAEVSETAAETEEALLLDAAVNISGSFGSSRLKYTITGKTKENCTLTISGKGKWVMCDDPKNVEHNPWNDSSSEDYTITSVVLEEGVTGIDGFCSTMRLQDVKTLSLPSTVSILSDYFANNWSSIASVTVAGGNQPLPKRRKRSHRRVNGNLKQMQPHCRWWAAEGEHNAKMAGFVQKHGAQQRRHHAGRIDQQQQRSHG